MFDDVQKNQLVTTNIKENIRWKCQQITLFGIYLIYFLKQMSFFKRIFLEFEK